MAEIFRVAPRDEGPFADHLHYHLFHLSHDPALLSGLRSAILHHECDQVPVCFRLAAAGLEPASGGKGSGAHARSHRCLLETPQLFLAAGVVEKPVRGSYNMNTGAATFS